MWENQQEVEFYRVRRGFAEPQGARMEQENFSRHEGRARAGMGQDKIMRGEDGVKKLWGWGKTKSGRVGVETLSFGPAPRLPSLPSMVL